MKEQKTEIKFLLQNFDSFLYKEVFCNGRVYSVRKMKDYIFADIFQKSCFIQIKISKKDIKDNIKSGDFILFKGVCSLTNKKEKVIEINEILSINKWDANIPFKHLNNYKYNPLKSFLPNKYKEIYFSNLIRNNLRKFFYQNDFFEVQTPILSAKYNGGKSFPVISSYLNEKIGFNRTTMEERMQALVGVGFENIFQIGSIFRSGKEKTFLEGYTTNLDFKKGKKIIREMLSYVVLGMIEQGLDKNNSIAIEIIKNNWFEIDFFDGAYQYLGINKKLLENFNNELIEELIKLKIIDKKDISPESLADNIANLIFKKNNKLVIIEGFPNWSSPLYKKYDELRLKRCRVYMPGQDGGFEIGVQENNINIFKKNIENQKKQWKLSNNDDRLMSSELEDVISAGLPEIVGFALSPDRILKIWIDNPDIDSYK